MTVKYVAYYATEDGAYVMHATDLARDWQDAFYGHTDPPDHIFALLPSEPVAIKIENDGIEFGEDDWAYGTLRFVTADGRVIEETGFRLDGRC